MKLGIRTRNLDIPARLRLQFEERVRLSIGHHVGGIETLRLTLSDLAAEAASGIRCQLVLRSVDGKRITLDETASDPASALDLALWRLGRSLRRRELP
jgi:ribosome-associated translation inhibitor RaiA